MKKYFVILLALLFFSCKKDDTAKPGVSDCDKLVNELPAHYAPALKAYSMHMNNFFVHEFKDSVSFDTRALYEITDAFGAIYNLKNATTDSLFEGYDIDGKFVMDGDLQSVILFTKNRTIAAEILEGREISDSTVNLLMKKYYMVYQRHEKLVMATPDTIVSIFLKSCNYINVYAFVNYINQRSPDVFADVQIKRTPQYNITYGYDSHNKLHQFTFELGYDGCPPSTCKKLSKWAFWVDENNQVVLTRTYGDPPPPL